MRKEEVKRQRQDALYAASSKQSEMYGELLLALKSGDTSKINIIRLRNHYYACLFYFYNKTASFLFSPTDNDKSAVLWESVEQRRVEAGVDPEHFIEAQFRYFVRHFNTVPTFSQLLTQGAVDRATGKVSLEKGNSSTTGKVTKLGKSKSHSIELSVEKTELFKQVEMLIQRMMVSQSCTREEFYRKFVVTGLYPLPREFLKADPVYQDITK